MESTERRPIDHVRHHHARTQVQTERDRLLKRADKIVDIQKFVPSDGKDRARAFLITVALLLPGMIGYVVMMLMWFCVYRRSMASTAVAFIVLVIASVMCGVLSTKKAMGKDRPWLWWIGALNLMGTLVALVIGFFLYFHFLCYYGKYSDMRTYTNVAAAQAGSTFADGSMFLFTKDTMLDPGRSVGYKSRWTGNMYCVAPIVDSTMNGGGEVFYWAIGMDCCTPRAEFHCDDAGDFNVRSALAVLEPEDVVRPSMRWAVRGAAYPHFREAIKLSEATYFTKGGRNPTLVYWTKDPISKKDDFYNRARHLCIVLSVIYTLLVAGTAFAISWRLVPKQRREGVIRTT
uniref:Uncharacterized protein n=1 Tax=Alexandrium monilatum TaxID=311494 RepID=A0A7S4SAY6_9DINO|mmetsp:Transcript_61459/g.193746  ORF Transcript_61459/g.193746 Transcript_61459/m.193746 type:complete len:346 (-) Transcript_61459:143-1180(-)